MRLHLISHFDRCTGCLICQLACSNVKFPGAFNPRYGLLNIDSTEEELASLPTVCEQCLNPYCQHVCLPRAIYRDQNTGALVIDEQKCTGCGWCARYCPLAVVRWEGKGTTARKCDLCGGEPECVHSCPTAALELVEVKG
jgi:Fe-S-cluster-containing hydrogenase component 2